LRPHHLGVADTRVSHSGQLEALGLHRAPDVSTDANLATAAALAASKVPMVSWLFPWNPPPHIDLTKNDGYDE
jgi:hypothetical protein